MVVPAQAPSSSNANYDDDVDQARGAKYRSKTKLAIIYVPIVKRCAVCVCVLYGTQSIVPFTFCDGCPLVSGGVGREKGGTSRTDQVSPLKSNEQFLGIADLGITKEKNLS